MDGLATAAPSRGYSQPIIILFLGVPHPAPIMLQLFMRPQPQS